MLFMKMHGLGNDFVVLDGREQPIVMTAELAQRIGDRNRGVGFDQLAYVSLENSDLRLTFFNSDGSTAGACGNATRCVARWLMEQTKTDELVLHTERGALSCRVVDERLTSVNMGAPLLNWSDVPLSHAVDVDHLPIPGDPIATGMGNPHCTFFVEDLANLDLETEGAKYETHPLFPDRTNVQFVEQIAEDRLRVRVWERGVGVTLASGSSSCAVAVAATRRGLTGRKVRIDLDGGTLEIDWQDDGVWMTGPTSHVFSGRLTAEFLAMTS